MPLRGLCAWTAHFSTICFTRVGECPFTGQHDLPSSLGVEVRRTPIVKVGCCRVGRLVQPHPEMETQRKCNGPRGVQELRWLECGLGQKIWLDSTALPISLSAVLSATVFIKVELQLTGPLFIMTTCPRVDLLVGESA